jgi:3-deoxy-manno-octulosonate cytidylyltransferase (CMP-KDO synthetase)
MSVLGVIPARYGATRFPGKPLADIAGKSLVRRVYEQAREASSLDGLLVATDDSRIFEHVKGFGGRAVMTRADHPSGTDRLGEVAQDEAHSYYVNIQGDEPLIDPQALDALVGGTLERGAAMSTLATPLASGSDAVGNPSCVKVVTDLDGYALYFSRSVIPYPRRMERAAYLKHVGVYMYSRETLLRLCHLGPTALELAEGLEQLRALQHGIRVLTVLTDYDPIAVDTPEDVARVVARLGGGKS